jgi:hypothetical protein
MLRDCDSNHAGIDTANQDRELSATAVAKIWATA